jgi:hypothetical protein
MSMLARWYPCCCPGMGSTVPGSSLKPGSSLDHHFGQRGSSGRVACACCNDGVAPLQVQVEALGIVPGDQFTCDECEDLNGTYILTWLSAAEYATYCLPSDTKCAWGLTFGAICSRNKAHLYMTCTSFPTQSVYLSFAVLPVDCADPINGALRWWKEYSGVSRIDCLFDGLELTAPAGGPALSCEIGEDSSATLYAL